MRFEGGSIVTAAACTMGALVVVSFVGGEGGEEALRGVLRWSTRLGVPLFAAAFAARPLRQLTTCHFSQWLVRNRRALGLSFAVMHFTHLAAIGALAWFFPEPLLGGTDVLTWVGGGVAYGLLAAMTVTSFDGPAHWLGPRRWRLLHRTGSYAIWLILTSNYVTQAMADWRLSAPALLLLGAGAARGAAWGVLARRRRAGLETSGPAAASR